MTPVENKAKPADEAGVLPASPAPAGGRHLVLLGAGHAHVHVLHSLAQDRPADLSITLVTPHPRQLYSGMVPGFVAGHYTLADCMIPLDGLLARSGVRHVQGSAKGLDVDARTVTLASGATLPYDWLSLDTGPVMDREKIEAQMPGAREHALFVRPIEAFGQLWPRVMAMARDKKIHLAVVGAGAAGLELAMAAAHALGGASYAKGSRVTLLSGAQPPGASYPASVQRRIARALQRLRIEVLPESCVGLDAGGMRLGNGQHLACDVPLLALGAQAPAWLAGSRLALDEGGFVAVNAFQQSTSHPAVFAAGDVASRVDAPHARSGVYAVRAGPPLLANLRAAWQGQPLKPYAPQQRTLNLLSCGGRHAIAVWGGLSVEGAWVWRWKDRIDRQFVARYAV
ncbi:FAD-dependent oxidoreductase [Polaromonas sp.]|uniref:FAD-dependent oxidoreductase n=1 Tax=Polaromonas sp. TaxID=1869339 RepID=UPI0013BC9DA9|nr:FAD-dependent oxidoreductase [Polaromonas sp.]NDP62882.1 FAD-dependent oxidoreductase [Polaromonas sp.]